ncbi:porin family protein [Mucilaginibacter sp. E4BP6]|uniref:porin family protein n=1 Tax=Mucilaginibacter sp. E4BP6 TaxID=2723089 RepID=UPI0015C8C180|nr:porin family protein [Mucilaginibacter sp. E4BP6]NYE67292.1 hypothetical protein [Mucilaginibacter sp. E4BP6]
MKKVILTLLLIAGISPAFAQSVKFGVSGGLNESILSLQNTINNDNSRLAGFHAGIFSDIDFGKVSIEPGLFYTTKGQNNKSFIAAPVGATFTANGKVTYNYLELPINILYNIPVGAGKFFIGGGPYVAYGLSGTSKGTTTENSNGTVTTSTDDYKLAFGGQDGDLKRIDFGLGALGGFALKDGLSISAGYEHGLTNIENSGIDKTKNNVISVSLGYCFL